VEKVDKLANIEPPIHVVYLKSMTRGAAVLRRAAAAYCRSGEAVIRSLVPWGAAWSSSDSCSQAFAQVSRAHPFQLREQPVAEASQQRAASAQHDGLQQRRTTVVASKQNDSYNFKKNYECTRALHFEIAFRHSAHDDVGHACTLRVSRG
jgi:hypothetical protein